MKPLRILIEMKHGLGDCVCMIPAIAAIRKNYPDAYIAMIVSGKANRDIFEHSQIHIDKFYYFSLKNRSKWHTIKTLFDLRIKSFTHGIMATMTPKKKGILLFRMLGIFHCFGEQYEGLNFLDLDNQLHFVKRNLRIIREFCPVIESDQPRLYADEAEGKKFEGILHSGRGKIAVNIGGADKNYYKGQYVYTRDWGRERMRELVECLTELKGYDIYLLGGALEEGLLSDYQEILEKEHVYNFVNRTTIGETIYLLSKCELSIGVDTGMQHVADALGIPTVSVFGPTNPKTHGAYSNKAVFVQRHPCIFCQYCFDTDAYYTCPDRKCLNQISPKKVYGEVLKVLAKRGEPR